VLCVVEEALDAPCCVSYRHAVGDTGSQCLTRRYATA
jgi:hypothetical protein